MQLFAAQFHTLDRWDAKAARVALHRSTHPDFRPLGEFIEEVTELVAPWKEPDKEWPVYGVDNVNGIFFSHRQLGSKFRQKYKRIRKGWFFHNPTRSAVGSLGMVPDVPADAITSPEYQVWRVTSGFLPEFLAIMIRTEAFKRLIRIHRVGTVKERLFVRNLQEITVPVPCLSVQGRIVAAAQSAENEIFAANAHIKKLQAKLSDSFLTALGLASAPRKALPNTFSMNWSAIGRWSIGYIRQVAQLPELAGGRYPVRRLGEAVDDLVNGWSPQCLNRPARPDEWGVLKLGAVSFGEFDSSENKALPPHLKPIPTLEVKPGDVLISRANVPRYVGACAIAREPRSRLMLCDKIFRVVFRQPSEIDAGYLVEILKIPHLRHQIESALTGTSPTMKNITKESLLNLQLPVPPINVQRSLVDRITSLRAAIAHERTAVAKLSEGVAAKMEILVTSKAPIG